MLLLRVFSPSLFPTACVFMCWLSRLLSQMGWHLVYDENKMDEHSRGWTTDTGVCVCVRERWKQTVCVWPFIFFCRLCSFMLLCVHASISVRVCPSVCVCGCVLYNTKASSCTFSRSLAILALCFPLALAQ